MDHRKIQNKPVTVTEFGFGASVIGNLYRVTSPQAAPAAVDAAWDAGVRYFDTSPHYGLGLSERRLGDALRDRPREEYVVSSKVGRLLVPNERARGVDDQGFVVRDDLRRHWDFSRDGVLRSLEDTLRRTGLDRLDVVYLHDPDDHWRQAADVVMLAGRYTLLDRSALDDVLPAAQAHGKSVVAVGVFNSGLLSRDRPAGGMKYDYQDAPTDLVHRAPAIAEVCERYGTTLPAAAIAFPSAHPAVVNVTLGMRTAEQLRRNVELHARRVPDGLWDESRAQGLIRADVPTASGDGRPPSKPSEPTR
ncbi:aldo/keto reductase [Streptomyces sp. CA-179760]|uniref:aldo/keto reductase n=1 Tax=Streptomyces sp. CA-179760 TaxID=3240054 RepID=UPI003D908D40